MIIHIGACVGRIYLVDRKSLRKDTRRKAFAKAFAKTFAERPSQRPAEEITPRWRCSSLIDVMLAEGCNWRMTDVMTNAMMNVMMNVIIEPYLI